MKSVVNPFIYGRALTPSEFLGRESELSRLFGRLSNGQSTAIIGQPHIGKTSLLNYIKDPPSRTTMFSTRFEQNLFSYLDAHTLHGVKTQTGFWESALAALVDYLKAKKLERFQLLLGAYELAKKNKFGAFVLEQLFNSLCHGHLRLILMLDEFDDFLSHPVLNSAEFYGSLRSFASRLEGFVLIVAARRDLAQLNQMTQQINPHGSPYFNVFTELKLGALSEKDLTELLNRADDRFNLRDYGYVTAVSGRHPYLAQVAAAMLWDVIDEGHHIGVVRYQDATKKLLQQTNHYFADTWNFWTNETRKAITVVALAQIQRFLTGDKFLASALIDSLDDYIPELEALKASGILAKDKEYGWIVTQNAFLWWLTDELCRNWRDDTDFKTWLQAQGMDNLLARQEQQRMEETAKKVLKAIGKSASTLITAFVQGIAEGVGEGLILK